MSGSGRTRRILAATVGVAVPLAVLGPPGAWVPPAGASGAVCGTHQPKLTVEGAGTASASPNLLTLTIGVSTTATTASAALTANDTAGTAVLSALKAGGVATKDLQTTGLSVQAQYASTGHLVTGYEVDDTVVAKIRDLASAGTLIDAAASAGGNTIRIDGLNYSLTSARTLQDKARSMAVRQAVRHASAMAAAAGDHLGPICSLTDETQTGSTSSGTGEGATAFSPALAARVPVQSGSQQETDQVRVVYALMPGRAKKR